MRKRKQISKEAIERKTRERDESRKHTLECNETRLRGFVANNETLLAQIEQQYADGEISVYQWELAMTLLERELDEEEEAEAQTEATEEEGG